jgi:hypothetical protein
MGGTAWLEAQAFLIKIKDEMLARALDTLDAEIKAGRAAINGRLVTAVEQNDSETRMFVLDNIVDNADAIIRRHSQSIEELEGSGSLDAATVERIEELKRFLLAVGKMKMLYDYSVELGGWASEVSADTPGSSIVGILSYGITDYRKEMLDFMRKNPGDALDDAEMGMIASILSG